MKSDSMATVEQIPKCQLRASAYDRASSWLVASLVVCSVVVAVLLLLYFARHYRTLQFLPVVKPLASGGGGGGQGGSTDLGTGNDSDLEAVSADDQPNLFESELNDTLSALAAAVTENADLIANEELDMPTGDIQGTDSPDQRRPGYGSGRGGGFGSGIGRGVGSGIGDGVGPGVGGPAEPKRELRFEPGSLNEYAQMLDYFRVELGVLNQQDNHVHYAFNLSQAVPGVRVGSPSNEERLFMIPTAGQFPVLDRRLVGKAGIGDRGRIIMQFYPPEVQAIFYDLEQRFAASRNRPPADIRLTVFRVTHAGDRFELRVEEQFYR
jgi:hypothetical protein